MRRIIEPLTRMGATVTSSAGFPPLVIDGAPLHAISHTPEVPSAQVKSCVLLAALFAEGTTEVIETAPTRDHTERALETFGVRVERTVNSIRLDGGQKLSGQSLEVPGDISGAAFWCALAAGTPSGRVEIENVGLNPTRIALIDLLRRAGAEVSTQAEDDVGPEPRGRMVVSAGEPRSFEISPSEVPAVIDEIPALAALAAMMPAGQSDDGARRSRTPRQGKRSHFRTGSRVSCDGRGRRRIRGRLYPRVAAVARSRGGCARRPPPRDGLCHRGHTSQRARSPCSAHRRSRCHIRSSSRPSATLPLHSGRNGACESEGRQAGCRGPRR